VVDRRERVRERERERMCVEMGKGCVKEMMRKVKEVMLMNECCASSKYLVDINCAIEFQFYIARLYNIQSIYYI